MSRPSLVALLFGALAWAAPAYATDIAAPASVPLSTPPSGFAPASSDTSFVPIAPVPGLDQGVSANQAGITAFLNNLYIFAIGIAVTLAVLMIVWGGIEYALSSAEITKKSEGKRRIQNALYGLVLVLAPAVVFAIINPAILNLNVNFPVLSTPWSNYQPGAACSDPGGCSPVPTNAGIDVTQDQSIVPCNGSDCSQVKCPSLSAKQWGNGAVNTAMTVCYNSSINKYYNYSSVCPTGSNAAVLCSITSATGVPP